MVAWRRVLHLTEEVLNVPTWMTYKNHQIMGCSQHLVDEHLDLELEEVVLGTNSLCTKFGLGRRSERPNEWQRLIPSSSSHKSATA